MRMTDEQIRELCERATPGPYTYAKHDAANCKGYVIGGADGTWAGMLLLEMTEDDVRFLTASIELVPQLLNRVTSLGDALDEAVSTANWQAEQMDKLDAELRQYVRDVERQNETLSVLARENKDLRLQVRDAQIRNAVLQKRLDKLIDVLFLECEQLPDGYCESPPEGINCEQAYECRECWREWLEQEVRA